METQRGKIGRDCLETQRESGAVLGGDAGDLKLKRGEAMWRHRGREKGCVEMQREKLGLTWEDTEGEWRVGLCEDARDRAGCVETQWVRWGGPVWRQRGEEGWGCVETQRERRVGLYKDREGWGYVGTKRLVGRHGDEERE